MSGMFCLQEIRARGWTDSLIRRFLGEPDENRPNPYSKKAAPMKLFNRSRVEAIESSPEFSNERKKVRRKQAAAAQAVLTKRSRLLSRLQTIQINVPIHSEAQLKELACKDYNDRQLYRSSQSGIRLAYPWSNSAFLDRICVNYLRHAMDEYHRTLLEMAGKVGCDAGYVEFKRRVLAAIGDMYSWLKAECEYQSNNVFSRKSEYRDLSKGMGNSWAFSNFGSMDVST